MRWFYPGVLFLILLYLFMKPTFYGLICIKGYPWPLIIGGLGIGAVIYLIQIHVVNQILSAIAQGLRWLVLRHTTTRTQEDRPTPRGLLNKDCIRGWWDAQANDIESPEIDEKRTAYMEYLNATYHATCMTWWLTPIFYCIKENPSPLYDVEWWKIAVFSGFMFIASLNLFARLSRVRY